MAESTKDDSCCGKFFLAILAIFLPPLAVGIREGCGCQLLVNILLTLLIFIPGVIHALYITCR